MRILAVDDDRNNLKMVAFLLGEEGYEVITTDDGTKALELVDSAHPDLVILDVMMPQIDGFEVCRRIRQTADVPIIMLSAKGETADRVAGLELGADDYLPKPFEPSELLARVKAVLRRSEIAVFDDPDAAVSISGLRLDPVSHRVILEDGQTRDLTPIEFRLLHCLMRNAGRTLTHDLPPGAMITKARATKSPSTFDAYVARSSGTPLIPSTSPPSEGWDTALKSCDGELHDAGRRPSRRNPLHGTLGAPMGD